MKPGSIPYSLFKQRREILRHYLSENNFLNDESVVIVGSAFEETRSNFRQESVFYYLTGVVEPGAILCMYQHKDILYLPNYGKKRAQWVVESLTCTPESAKAISVDEMKFLGEECPSYTISPLFNKAEYHTFIEDIAFIAQSPQGSCIMMLDGASSRHIEQKRYYTFLVHLFPDLVSRVKDAASLVHMMRRVKDAYELECMYRAAAITSYAHRSVAQAIKPGVYEYEMQALLESVFTLLESSGPAFPSIVATGKNSTILHYTARNAQLQKDDLVVIDIGADYAYYASDITRTYPVGGTFTPRQREVYSIVLEAQQYIESLAQPGMYLNNSQYPEQSLQHCAMAFFKKAGYDSFFCHGIGHYLGIDVHDVGNSKDPLVAGDVITIEPGIYIPQENIGIRIEDDYVIMDDGCICLSNDLPKSLDDIESLMKPSIE